MKMNGIKLSSNCTRLVQGNGCCPDFPLHASLSSECINIEFLNFDGTGEASAYLSCCVKQEHTMDTVELTTQITHGVHALSVYPHRSRMSTLGYLVCLMSHKSLLFYDLVTSGSMLTFVVDGQDRPQICEYLARNIELPESHTPFEQILSEEDQAFLEKCRKETCATWVEDKIKTYGIQLETDLTLFSLTTGYEDLARIAEIMQASQTEGCRFYYSSAHGQKDGRVCWHFLSDGDIPRIKTKLPQDLPQGRSIDLKIFDAMSLISFQGPHFGDRYGIADRAIAILKAESIPLLLAGFTGSSINMTVPASHAPQACEALQKIFTCP